MKINKLKIPTKNEYIYGKDFEMDMLRANKNLTEITKGKHKRKKPVKPFKELK